MALEGPLKVFEPLKAPQGLPKPLSASQGHSKALKEPYNALKGLIRYRYASTLRNACTGAALLPVVLKK